jgi:hypothetical protein
VRPYQHYTDARRPLEPVLRKTSLSGFYETKPDEQEMIMAHTLKSLLAKHPDNGLETKNYFSNIQPFSEKM